MKIEIQQRCCISFVFCKYINFILNNLTKIVKKESVDSK